MPENIPARPKRLLHLDLLRLFAIYLVIFNHTGNRGYLLFADSMASGLYFPYMLASVFCKIAVPLFFMISGALLLPKQESLGRLFSKRILRMVTVLILISVPYYFWLHRAQGLSPSDFLTYIYGNSASTSLWYLYSYVALLLMLPFLRSMVKGMGEKDFRYLIVCYLLLTGGLPCLEFCLWKDSVTIHKSFNPVLFLAPNIFYALVGYYMEYVVWHRNRKRVISLGLVLSAAALAATCFMTHYRISVAGAYSPEQVERFFNCFICIPAMTVYYAAKCAGERIRGAKLQKLLTVLGGAVFGVYLLEKISRALTDPVYVLLEPFVGSFVASLIWALVALAVSIAAVVLLKHMPVIKKAVNRFI